MAKIIAWIYNELCGTVQIYINDNKKLVPAADLYKAITGIITRTQKPPF